MSVARVEPFYAWQALDFLCQHVSPPYSCRMIYIYIYMYIYIYPEYGLDCLKYAMFASTPGRPSTFSANTSLPPTAVLTVLYDIDCLIYGLDCLIYGLDCLMHGLDCLTCATFASRPGRPSTSSANTSLLPSMSRPESRPKTVS